MVQTDKGPVNLVPFEDAEAFANWCCENTDGPLSCAIGCSGCGELHRLTFATAEELGSFISTYVVIPQLQQGITTTWEKMLNARNKAEGMVDKATSVDHGKRWVN